MLHKIDLEGEHVVGFRWEGEFDEKGFKQSVLQFLPELQKHSKMKVYLEVGSLTEVQAKALYDEIKFDLKNYKDLLNKIEKVALVTDMSWMRTMAETSASFVPKIKVKAFEIKEAEAAKTWVK